MIKGNKILIKANILLIVVILILSTGAATANTLEKHTKPITRSKSNYEPTIAHLGVEILSEGFEDGEMPPPGGWYTIDKHPTDNWDIVDNDTYPQFVHSGDYAGWVNWDDQNSSDEWLVSPDIDLTEFDEVTLVFWAEADTNWPGATVELHVLGDDLDDIIWDLIEDENWDNFTYREMVFDLSEYTSQIISIAWRYVGFDGQSFGLDDILIFEEELIPPVPVLNITNIIAGTGKLTAELKNNGDVTAKDIVWETYVINVGGGLLRKFIQGYLFFPKIGEGTIPSLGPGNTTEFNINMLGFGFTTVSFNLKYTIQNLRNGDVDVEVFQEENILGLFVFLDNELIPQPDRTWVKINDPYYTGTDTVELPHEILQLHQVRVHDAGSTEILFQSSCSFNGTTGILQEGHITKDIVMSGNAYWEVELVGGM